MTNPIRILHAVLLAAALAAPTSAEVLFQDNFNSHPDGDTASVWQGGTPNDPSLGDADPLATIGTWNRITESAPWFAQVSTATNGPPAGNLPGPSGGSGKYLVLERQNNPIPTDVRGRLTTPATGQLSIDFQLGMVGGLIQFFVRDRTTGSFDGLPLYVNFDPDQGRVIANGTTTSLTFDPLSPRYTSVNVLINIPTQKYSLTVNGMNDPSATNLPLSEAVTEIREFSFYVVDFGLAGVDNVLAQSVGAAANNADFDGDHDVDGADFLTWQRGLGKPSPTHGDGNADGDSDVDAADLAIWKTQFGTPQALVAASAIPEPCSVVLVGLGWLALAQAGRRAAKQH